MCTILNVLCTTSGTHTTLWEMLVLQKHRNSVGKSVSQPRPGCWPPALVDCFAHLLRFIEGAKVIFRESGGGARVRPGRLSCKAPDLKASPPCCPDVELDLQRSVQAVLRELGAQAPALRSNRGKSQQALPLCSPPPHPSLLSTHSQQTLSGPGALSARGFPQTPHPAGNPWSKSPETFLLSAHPASDCGSSP